jgi:predicted nucleic acid-binding Zn ribbon protein
MFERTCIVCGKTFLGWKNQKYCSKLCSQKANCERQSLKRQRKWDAITYVLNMENWSWSVINDEKRGEIKNE